MVILVLILCAVALIGSGGALWLVYEATKKIQIVRSVPCIHCQRQVQVYTGEVDGPKECHFCQSRRR